uniref:AMP-binding domain-containing protein n=1 Tax=Elaeophora elaphi TaxID=1147741 RepID=A0A0R3RFA2_9BILA
MEMSMAPIAETFSMIYVEEADNSYSTAVGHADIMNEVSLIAERLASYRNCLIAIVLPKHPAFVSAILGVMESKNCFVYCSSIEIANSYRSATVSCIISTTATEDNHTSINTHGLQIYFHHNGYYYLNDFGEDKLCYLITTSGTLGKRKEVLVPYSCIMPNIWDFSKVCYISKLFFFSSRQFRITTSDVILFSTAATFDPFVVEILLAVVNGAKLLVVPDSFRSVPIKLADSMLKHGMTASQLKILPHQALTEIFAGRSTIRTIILGGEAFPINFIKRYHIDHQSINLYNVYGITEVSCWASCHRVDLKETRVEIGEPLLDTKFKVSETGELLIGGSRRCFINGKLSGAWLPSGDIVELDELGKIYWCDRSDDQQKISGINVSLSGLARKAEEYDGIQSAIALCREQSILLFVHAESKRNVETELCRKLAIGLPLMVILVDSWPVTKNESHFSSRYLLIMICLWLENHDDNGEITVTHNNVSSGKTDRRKLLQIFEEKNLIFTIEDLSKLFQNFKINLKASQDMAFKDLGFDSLRAVELTLKTGHLLKQRNFPLLQYLLSDTGTIAGFLDALDFSRNVQERNNMHVREVRIRPIENSIDVKLLWEYDLGKCIDAMPTVENDSIFLGSHSGRFASLSLDGNKEWEVQFGDRIEATACCRDGITAVGCYDGYLYFLDEKSGQLIWKFGTGNIIKSSPLLINAGNKCLFGSHDKYLYLLDIKNYKMLWKVGCDGSILSSPVLTDTVVLCATLGGEFLGVELDTGNVLWKIQLDAPIFANLCIVELNRVLVVNVKGLVTLCDTRTGHIMYQYDILECIFATPVLFRDDANNSNVIIVTQASSLFLLQTDTLQLLWHIRIDGVGSFPRPPEILDNNFFIQDSSGTLLAIKGLRDMMKKNITNVEISMTKIIKVLKVPGETFGGVRILKMDKKDSNSSKSGDSSSSNSSGSNSNTSVVSYRALIGSRDDRIRCFYFSL